MLRWKHNRSCARIIELLRAGDSTLQNQLAHASSAGQFGLSPHLQGPPLPSLAAWHVRNLCSALDRLHSRQKRPDITAASNSCRTNCRTNGSTSGACSVHGWPAEHRNRNCSNGQVLNWNLPYAESLLWLHALSRCILSVPRVAMPHSLNAFALVN